VNELHQKPEGHQNRLNSEMLMPPLPGGKSASDGGRGLASFSGVRGRREGKWLL